MLEVVHELALAHELLSRVCNTQLSAILAAHFAIHDSVEASGYAGRVKGAEQIFLEVHLLDGLSPADRKGNQTEHEGLVALLVLHLDFGYPRGRAGVVDPGDVKGLVDYVSERSVVALFFG